MNTLTMRKRLLAAGLLCALSAFLYGDYVPADRGLEKGEIASGTQILPEGLLREYDPVTVFFAHETGKAPGSEDHPEKYVQTSFKQPGEFRWIDAKTLQFRPAEPWPVLRKIIWKCDGKEREFFTMMGPPLSVEPYPGSTGLSAFSEVRLTLDRDLSPSDLRSLLSLEIRPLPGLDAGKTVRLSDNDYQIKKVERKSASEPYTWLIQLQNAVEPGRKLLMRLRLCLNERVSDSVVRYEFSTRSEFRLTAMGAGYTSYPVSADGSQYNQEQALNGGEYRNLFLEFSDTPAEAPFSEVKNLIRIAPSVENFQYQFSGNRIYVSGGFRAGTLYAVRILPANLKDTAGRPLSMAGESSFYMYFPKKGAEIGWERSEGILERFGPRQFPMQSRDIGKADLRVYRIDPLNRQFWPFPAHPVVLDESVMPFGPGEEPSDRPSSAGYLQEYELQNHLRMLGSPSVSRVVDLPVTENGSLYQFGVDLGPLLDEKFGTNLPGSYLVGYRNPNGGKQRHFVRVQVTDLCLSVLQAFRTQRLFVTSYRSALPQSGVTVTVEGYLAGRPSSGSWAVLFKGATDQNGQLSIPSLAQDAVIMRLILSKDDDIAVYHPSLSAPLFAGGYWQQTSGTWLSAHSDDQEAAPPVRKGFLFPERPIYKPEETVYLKGYARSWNQGRLSLIDPKSEEFHIQVTGPGGKEWDYPVPLSEFGSADLAFTETNAPTGYFSARFYSVVYHPDPVYQEYGSASFRKEAYRIPTFEVLLHGEQRVPLDKPFKVGLTASYYAGGSVNGQPVRWSVTSYPHAWAPQGREGWIFSSDSRYGGYARGDDRGVLQKEENTDNTGASRMVVDPTASVVNMPTRYVFEATVTGADDETVTATYDVIALPSFVLGMSAERFVRTGNRLKASVCAVDGNGDNSAGVEVSVKLVRREWHSRLQEAPFAQGKPQFFTEQVDTELEERVITTAYQPNDLEFTVPAGGIYLIKLEARDALGRLQSLSADIYMAQDAQLTWQKPEANVFRAVPDKSTPYRAGETARILLESPFQNATVLAVLEKPDGLSYRILEVDGGKAEYLLPIESRFATSVPVSFLLMRPRESGKNGDRPGDPDTGKPQSLASTVIIPVAPTDNELNVKLTHPPEGMPGKKFDIEIKLSDSAGKPVAGEVTLWLVDQAVLSLGNEIPLDPLPHFTDHTPNIVRFIDFRASAVGRIRWSENPGGDGADEESSRLRSLMDKASVRKNFKTVPFYSPNILVDASGKKTVTVELPDNLTVFQIRAVACTRGEKLGSAKSKISVRLPLALQSAMPRFVRYGDEIRAGAIGRVVLGGGGKGAVSVEVKGAALKSAPELSIEWDTNQAMRFYYPMQVESPRYNADGERQNENLVVKIAAARLRDEASDAVEVTIPIREDRGFEYRELVTNLAKNVPMDIPGGDVRARPGTMKREVLLSPRLSFLKAVSGMDYMLRFPHGCLEQKISKTVSAIRMKKLYQQFGLKDPSPMLDRIYEDTMETVTKSRRYDGLYSYWPGSTPYVYLTAYVLEFLVEAKSAGYAVPDEMIADAKRVLKRALRSDYSQFIDGYHYQERVSAMYALAVSGEFNSSYADELARAAELSTVEYGSKILQTLLDNRYYDGNLTESLKKSLWNRTLFMKRDNREVFAGLQPEGFDAGGVINAFEQKSLADMIRALAVKDGYGGKMKLMVDFLVQQGGLEGWGNTWINASVLRALTDYLKGSRGGVPKYSAKIAWKGGDAPLRMEDRAEAAEWATSREGGMSVMLENDVDQNQAPFVRLRASYVPLEPGDRVAASASGFVVTKEIVAVRPGRTDERTWLRDPGTAFTLKPGDVLEEHIQVINPSDRYFVAVVCPLAAGLEPLNPNLRTAPPEAVAKGVNTLSASYEQFLDDRKAWYFDHLPKGAYDFYFRVRAGTEGSFTEPPAYAEWMYGQSVRGNTPGMRVIVKP